MSLRSVLRGIFWSAVALVLVFHLAVGWYFSNAIIEEDFEPVPAAVVFPSGDYRIEEVVFDSPLGEFDAWYLPSFRNTWVIHVHGDGSSPAQAEFLFERLQEAGYPQLAITYRNDEGQPESPSGIYDYGASEHEDLAGAVAYARGEGAEAIVLSGFGSGGAHVLSYLARSNLDAVKAAILDSPVTDLAGAIDHKITKRELPLIPVFMPQTVSYVARFFTALRVDVNWRTIDYVDGASSLRRPLLVHHGSEDEIAPIDLSLALAEAAPDQVTLIEVEGAGHVGSYDIDPEKYVGEVLDFLARAE